MPPTDLTSLTLTGARPMPGQAGVYVAIACVGGEPLTLTDDQQCGQTGYGASRPPMHVYVGLIQVDASGPPRLLAKPTLFDGAVDWSDTLVGDEPVAAQEAKDGVIEPETITRFDLAAYTIAPGQRAFGLIGTWNEGYAGGGADFSALYLFAVVDGAVKQVLSTPMSFSKMLAGDWHKDGTRDHDLTEEAAVLVVTPHLTAGHFDLQQKVRLSKATRVFKWSAADGRYEVEGG